MKDKDQEFIDLCAKFDNHSKQLEEGTVSLTPEEAAISSEDEYWKLFLGNSYNIYKYYITEERNEYYAYKESVYKHFIDARNESLKKKEAGFGQKKCPWCHKDHIHYFLNENIWECEDCGCEWVWNCGNIIIIREGEAEKRAKCEDIKE